MTTYLDLGIFRDTLAPSLALHSTLALPVYAIGRYFNYAESKDWLWPSGQVANAWWSAVGRRVIVDGASISTVIGQLSRPEWLLLTGVSAWGLRLLYRIASRAISRGKDDSRYEEVKNTPGFWNKAFFSLFVPEAIVQTIITLPFTAPFRHQGTVMTGHSPYLQMVAVGLFGTGFAVEALADWQLASHQADGKTSLLTDGVWSIVRHPNYLGDVLVHLSFPLLLYSSDMLAPIELLGPIANYLFLRYMGGDKQTEESQVERYTVEKPQKREQLDGYRDEKNAFWPSVNELVNKWTWVVLGLGAVGVAVEQGILHTLRY